MEGAYNALFLHFVHDSRRAGIAQLQTALEHGDGSLSGLQNHIHGGGQHFVTLQLLVGGVGVGHARRLFAGLLGFFLDLVQHLLAVFRRVVVLDIPGHGLNLGVGDETALHTQRLSRADGRVEHIAHTDELFRAGGIENDAALE